MTETTNVQWNLNDLYSGMDDPRVEETLAAQSERSDSFAEEYKGKINNPSLTAPALYKAIEEYESILQEVDKPMAYASLLFSADTSDESRGAFLQKIRERTSDIIIRLMFFELELMVVSDEKMSVLLAEPVMAKYKHYVWAERLFADYRLSEPEEKILEEKANTGRRAFTRLFEQITSGMAFDIVRDGKKESLNLQELLSLTRESDRELRKAAAGSLTEGLERNSRNLTYIFNTLIQDKATDDRLRKYSYPEQARHLGNELDRETVEVVVKTAIDNYPLVARYYNLKREILGYDKLMHYDRYAPLFEAKEDVPYERAKDIVLASFGRLSPVMEEPAALFFDNSWIDAEVRKGKRGGAFCSYVTPDLHPYVFVNYLNRMDDVKTLGHELGHGVHAYLARKQGYLNFSPVLPVAELASTFGEMLVFESLQKQAGLDDKMALYAEKIEDSFATIFRQAAMYRFEQAIHQKRREKGELTMEEFSEIWQDQQQKMFGDSVELGDEHRFWWMYVSHFIGSPFYVYAYTFGELLVMAFYAMYRREGEAFAPKYIDLLEMGGSTTPADMLSRVGIDIRAPAFWQGGMSVLSGMVDEFTKLYSEWKGKSS